MKAFIKKNSRFGEKMGGIVKYLLDYDLFYKEYCFWIKDDPRYDFNGDKLSKVHETNYVGLTADDLTELIPDKSLLNKIKQSEIQDVFEIDIGYIQNTGENNKMG